MNGSNGWTQVLPPEILRKADLMLADVSARRAAGANIFPPEGLELRALALTPPEHLRAVILGQDPYPTAGHANGLAFSVNPDVSPLPRSLNNIFQEYRDDLGLPLPASGDLTPWAQRGVLLLNPILTVEEGSPLSHKNLGWQRLTAAVLRATLTLPQSVVYLLWGRKAIESFFKAAGDGALPENKRILAASHPSPLGARRSGPGMPAFLGSRPFSGANRILEAQGEEPIDWQLP